jgi:hypothetical protein
MDDKNMECVEDIENFDLSGAEYRVLIQGIGEDGEELEGVNTLRSSKDPEKAVAAAKERLPGLQMMLDFPGAVWGGKPLAALHIWVETVVDLEGEEHFAGAIYQEVLHKAG